MVASAVGGVPEFVIDGVTGFLHKPQDANAFADAILRVYSKPDVELETIKRNAEKYVKEHFSMEFLVNDIINVYSLLLA